jgi:hypothetical protein
MHLIAKLVEGVILYMFDTTSYATKLFQSTPPMCPKIADATAQADIGIQADTDSALCRNGSFALALEDFSHNWTYSLFKLPQWVNETMSQKFTTLNAENHYVYRPTNLLVAYGFSALVTAICTLYGLWALHPNGYTGSTRFFAIILTTRNLELDEPAKGHCLGRQCDSDALKGTRLRFGVLHDGATAHSAFGRSDEIVALKKSDIQRL